MNEHWEKVIPSDVAFIGPAAAGLANYDALALLFKEKQDVFKFNYVADGVTYPVGGHGGGPSKYTKRPHHNLIDRGC